MMKNKYSILMITVLLCLDISGQSTYTGTEMNFYGRWIEWADGEIYPKTNVSTQLTDPLNEATGFWSSSFTIPMFYSDDIAAKGWVTDIHEAVGSWNSGSNLAKLSAQSLQGNIRTYDVTNTFNRQNVIFLSDNPALFDLQKDLAAAFPLFFFSDLSKCSSGNWQLGPLIIEVDVGFNDTQNWYSGIHSTPSSNDEYSVYKVTMHELGHVFGLDHWPYKKDKRIIMHSHTNADNGRLQPEDFSAINELYGKDGLNNGGANPFYSNIPCDYFTFGGVSSHKLTPRSGETMAYNSPDPCDNCFKDPYEDGINCGVNSDCGVLCEDQCSYNGLDLVFIDYDIPLYTYTVAKNTVNITCSNGDINFDGDYKYLKAGDFIDVNPGPYFFDTGVNGESEFRIGSCDCPSICTPVLPNVITPGCDGINDYLYFQTNGADYFDFEVYNRNGATVYNTNGSINSTNSHRLVNWNGLSNNGNVLPNGVYWYILTLTSSCSGETKDFTQEFSIFNGEGHPCSEITDPMQKRSLNSSIEEVSTSIGVNLYPNPTSELLYIESSDFIISEVAIIDMGGKLIRTWEEINSDLFNVNLNDLTPNSIVVRVTSTTGQVYTETVTKVNE